MQSTSDENTSECSAISPKASAFAKIFAARPSRGALRASMLEKSRRLVDSGQGGLEPVVVREFR